MHGFEESPLYSLITLKNKEVVPIQKIAGWTKLSRHCFSLKYQTTHCPTPCGHSVQTIMLVRNEIVAFNLLAPLTILIYILHKCKSVLF